MGPGKHRDPGCLGNVVLTIALMKQLYGFFFCTNVKFFLKVLLFHPSEKPIV